MVHKHFKTTGPKDPSPFREVPPHMASTPSNSLLYITTDETEEPDDHDDHLLSPQNNSTITSARHHAGRRRLTSQGHEEREDQVSPAVQSETINIIDAVAKTLCGDNMPPHGGDAFNQFNRSRRRGSLPPIYINQTTTHGSHTMPEIDIDGSECGRDGSPLFARRTHTDLPKGFNPGRRNSMMVPLPSHHHHLHSGPLIPPRSRERSQSLSPNHKANRLSPLYPVVPYQYEDTQTTIVVPIRNLRRKSIANIQSTLPENIERTESSLDLV